jgi:hypothetical protein
LKNYFLLDLDYTKIWLNWLLERDLSVINTEKYAKYAMQILLISITYGEDRYVLHKLPKLKKAFDSNIPEARCYKLYRKAMEESLLKAGTVHDYVVFECCMS